jgi:hypothetical protein
MENHYWKQETARTTTSPERQTRTVPEHCKEAPSISGRKQGGNIIFCLF